MATVGDLLDQASVDKLARLRIALGQKQEQTASTPVKPECPTCTQPLPVPGAVFQPAEALDACD